MADHRPSSKLARRAVSALALLACLMLIAGYVWLGSSHALQWVAQQATLAAGGTLAIEGASGSLAGEIRIAKLGYDDGGHRFESENLIVRWQPLALLRGELRISRLNTTRIVYAGSDDAPPEMPGNLALPLDVSLVDAQVGSLELQGLPKAEQLALHYHGGRHAHEFDLARIRIAGQTLSGRLHADTRPPFAIRGSLQATGELRGKPARLLAQISGDLARLQISAGLEGLGGHAQAVAAVQPFGAALVETLSLQGRDFDLSAWDATLPQTLIDIQTDARTAADGLLQGSVRLSNAAPGSMDARKVPLQEARLAFSGTARNWTIADIILRLPGSGRITGKGTLREGAARFDLQLRHIEPPRLHSRLQPLTVDGRVTLSGNTARQDIEAALEGARLQAKLTAHHAGGLLVFERVQLSDGNGRVDADGRLALNGSQSWHLNGGFSRLDPSRFLRAPSGRLNGSVTASGRLQPSWQGEMQLKVTDSTLRGSPVSADARFSANPSRPFSGTVSAMIGTNRIDISGNYGQPQDRLQWNLLAPDLRAIDPAFEGYIQSQGTVAGTLDAPTIVFRAEARKLAVRDLRLHKAEAGGTMAPGSGGALRLDLRASGLQSRHATADSLEIHGSGTRMHHALQARLRGREVDATLRASGGFDAQARWTGMLEQLDVGGRWPVRLTAPANIMLGAGLLRVDQLRASALDGEVGPVTIRAEGGRITTSGTLRGINAARLLPHNPAIEVRNLRFGARWDLTLNETFSGSAELRREQGDVALVSGERVAMDLRQLALSLTATDNAVNLTFDAESGAMGRASARLDTRVSRRDGAWLLPGDALLAGNASAELRSLAWLRLLLPELDLASGRFTAQTTISGTVAEPRFAGNLAGDNLALRALEPGIDLRDGRIRASLDGKQLKLGEFRFAAGKGQISADGSADITGGLRQLDITARAERAQIFSGPQLSVIISGEGRAGLRDLRLALEGDFRVDEGRYDLGTGRKPALGSDVVIKTAATTEKPPPSPLRVALNVGVNLNDRFTVRGFGLNALLGGSVRITTRENGLSAQGIVRTVRGEYSAFGQPLDIERGALVFSGPLANPGIDLRAMRKIQAVEVGVEVSGSLQRPRVKLASTPDMPDSQRLAWLALGRDPRGASSAELAVLQAAALTLAGSGGTPLQGRLARELGLDEIGIAQGSEGSLGALSLGKHITSKLTVRLEQTLGGTAGSIVRIDYLLSDRWRLRGTAGAENAADILFTLRFD